ncbi:MAG: hypothetical protein HY243_19255 [Proteobacteria bacterium]|nr:hypothetical protein [Pseudomonadota bacterium]
MPDFWRNSGFHLLRRDDRGWLTVTDDFLRAYYLRPEVYPVEESGDAELALHSSLMAEPGRKVDEEEIEAVEDEDARDNYRVVLRFRDRLLAAGTLEGAYAALFRSGSVDIPPLFIEQMAHVILRNILDGVEDPLRLRAGELLFRDQKLNLQDSTMLLADLETVEMHAAGNAYGSIGRLIVDAQTSLKSVELDVLDRDNAGHYWQRESRYDTVISINHGRAALEAFCRVIEAWVRHFHGVEVKVRSLPRIDEPRWAWHIGLDAASTGMLNDLYEGIEVDHGRMRRLLSLFRMDFANASDMRPDIAGRPVYLALSANEDDIVRMKPQNLLVNFPMAKSS